MSHTSSLKYSVGASWEIIRSTSLTPDNRVIDLYTKAGALGLYFSVMILIPDFDIALTVLVAGDSSAVRILGEAVIDQFLPLVDAVAKSQTQVLYGGKYGSPQASNSSQSSITLVTDAGPGLSVTQWLSEGQDILTELRPLFDAQKDMVDMRLYPTGLATTTERSFRAVVQVFPGNDTRAAGVPGVLSDPCQTWVGIDGAKYGLIAADDFVFQVGKGGKVTALEPRVLRETLMKVA